jgi:hypothetical protein
MSDQWPAGEPIEGTGSDDTADEGLLETAVSVLTQPVPTLRRLTLHPRVGWAIGVAVVLGLLSGIVNAAQLGGSPQMAQLPPEMRQWEGAAAVGAAVAGPIVTPLLLAAGAGILHLVSRLLGGAGSYRGLFVGVVFADVPSALGIPAQLLPLVLGVAGQILAALIGFALFVWVVVLAGVAVRENNGFSTARAAAALLIPVGLLFGLVIVLAVLVFATLMGTGLGA